MCIAHIHLCFSVECVEGFNKNAQNWNDAERIYVN